MGRHSGAETVVHGVKQGKMVQSFREVVYREFSNEAPLKMKPRLWMAAGFMLISSSASAVDIPSGSGFVVGKHGEVLTNAHVVDRCDTIDVELAPRSRQSATVVAVDRKNDLAVVRLGTAPKEIATFREGKGIRSGDSVVALGYPLRDLLAAGANLSVGTVSALAGLRDDSRYLQISAPVQPGNSGGPLLDSSGNIVGVVT